MYTRFNDNTIETKFIKQLVAKTQVPFISTWKPGDFAVRGMVYITRDSIWKCNHTGWPKHLMDTCTPTEHTTIVNEHGIRISYTSDESIPYFTKVSSYNFGKEYYNVTGSYQSNILGYDATTHFYLGQYLRMMRDIFDLDLMPFYNCFCGEYVSDVDFDSTSNVIVSTTDQYKIASVPVKFGKKYMIAINSEVPVETMLVVYGRKGLIRNLTENLNDIQVTNQGTIYSEGTYKKYQRTCFQDPVIYETKSWHQLYNVYTKMSGRFVSDVDENEILTNPNYDQALGQFEKYLRLLIKVPKNNTSSLVVLEGDYRLTGDDTVKHSNAVTWTNREGIGATVNSKVVTGEWVRPKIIKSYYKQNENGELVYVDSEKEETQIDDSPVLLSPLGLLQMSDGNSYAFSNRLIEYLLQNVINPLEEFGDNITRIQQYSKSYENNLKNGSRFTKPVTPGVWDEDLREYLFNLVRDTKYLTTKVDLTGYVDKDTERIITRGQKV